MLLVGWMLARMVSCMVVFMVACMVACMFACMVSCMVACMVAGIVVAGGGDDVDYFRMFQKWSVSTSKTGVIDTFLL